MKISRTMIKDWLLRSRYNKYVCNRSIHDSVTDTLIARKGDFIYVKKVSQQSIPLSKVVSYTFTIRLAQGHDFEMLATDLIGNIRLAV
jgi:hypothetical protein